MLVPILPDLKKHLNISEFQSSLVISVFSISAAVTIPILGYLSDRFTRKAVVIPALTLYGLGGLLAGIAAAWFAQNHTFIWILIGRIMQGIGAAGTTSMAMALAGDLFEGGEQSKVLGIVEASNGFGNVISPIIGSLLALLFWYATFFAFPVFCFISILLTKFFIKEKKNPDRETTVTQYFKGLAAVFRSDGKWLSIAYLTGATCLFTLFGILFYISEVLEADYKIDGLLKGTILAIPLLFMTTTSLITGRKIGKKLKLMKRLIVLGLIFMTVSFSCLVFFDKQLIPFFSVLVISSIGTGLALPCINSLITGAVSIEKRGFVTSIYGSVRFLGVAIGPPIYSALMNWSTTGMFLSTAGLTLLVALLCMFFIKVKPSGESKEDKKNEKQMDSLFEKVQLT